MTIRGLVPLWRRRRGVERFGFPAHEEVRDLFREMFEDFFGRQGLVPWPRLPHKPAVDVSETDEEYRVSVELPGLGKDDIEVSIERGYLTISGERKEEEREEKENFLRLERFYGSFTRTIPLPASVDEKAVEASFKDGLLSLRLPKTEEARGRRIEIKAD